MISSSKSSLYSNIGSFLKKKKGLLLIEASLFLLISDGTSGRLIPLEALLMVGAGAMYYSFESVITMLLSIMTVA